MDHVVVSKQSSFAVLQRMHLRVNKQSPSRSVKDNVSKSPTSTPDNSSSLVAWSGLLRHLSPPAVDIKRNTWCMYLVP